MASLEETQKKTMVASDYEQQRQDNIKRNKEMIASILHKKSQFNSLFYTKRKYTKSTPSSLPRRQSLRSRGLSPSKQQLSLSFTDAIVDSGSYKPLIEATCGAAEENTAPEVAEEDTHLSLNARVELGLKENNVTKVVGERITTVRFLPLLSRSVVVAGNWRGQLEIWDADHDSTEDEEGNSDGVFFFSPHRGSVSGISVHPSSVTKIYSSCYKGDICLMDTGKEMFNIIHSSDMNIFSLSQSPHDHNSLFLGEMDKVKSFDQRAGQISNNWKLHLGKVNTIDIHPENTSMIVTSSTDKFVRIWDLRFIHKDKPKFIKEVAHRRAAYSAYFSPAGNGIVSTGIDDTIRILSGPQFENLSIIKHENQTGVQFLSSLRAIWGWNDSYIFIGNMLRAIDVISTEHNITSPLQSEHMSNIPFRIATHPYKEGHLACAGGGKLHLWTRI